MLILCLFYDKLCQKHTNSMLIYVNIEGKNYQIGLFSVACQCVTIYGC